MSDELTRTPRIDGEFWVFADGRRLPRLRGAETASEDTPADDAAPAEGTPAPGTDDEQLIDYEKRYNDLRPQWTQATQRLSEFEDLRARAISGDREAFNQLLDERYELPDDQNPDQGDEYEEPGFQDPRVDTLLQELEQLRQGQIQQEGKERFNADLDKIAGDKSESLSDDDRDMLYAKTIQNGATQDALTTVYDDFAKARAAYDKAVIQRYIDSKRAPHVSQGGTGATDEVLPLDATHEQRVAYMAQRLGISQDY